MGRKSGIQSKNHALCIDYETISDIKINYYFKKVYEHLSFMQYNK